MGTNNSNDLGNWNYFVFTCFRYIASNAILWIKWHISRRIGVRKSEYSIWYNMRYYIYDPLGNQTDQLHFLSISQFHFLRRYTMNIQFCKNKLTYTSIHSKVNLKSNDCDIIISSLLSAFQLMYLINVSCEQLINTKLGKTKLSLCLDYTYSNIDIVLKSKKFNSKIKTRKVSCESKQETVSTRMHADPWWRVTAMHLVSFRGSCSIEGWREDWSKFVFITPDLGITHHSTTIHHTEWKRDWGNDRRGWKAGGQEREKREREREASGWIATIRESLWLMVEYNTIFIKLISLQPVYNTGYGQPMVSAIWAPSASFSRCR